MTTITGVLCLAGGLLFLISATAHVMVRVRRRPRRARAWDNCYYEFEDQHPEYAQYERWLRITLGGASLGILLLFLGAIL
jgi:hypothetical protein